MQLKSSDEIFLLKESKLYNYFYALIQLPIGEGQEGEGWMKSNHAVQCVPKIEHKDTCPVNYIFPFPFHLTKQESLK